MADVADLLITGAQKGISESTPDFQKAVSEGSQIAARMEQAQINRQKLENQKQELQGKKLDSMITAISKADKIKDPKTKNMFLKKFIPKQRDALGLGDVISDEMLEFVMTDENRLKLNALRSRVQRGEMSFSEAQQVISEPQLLIDFSLSGEDFLEAESKFLGRESQERAKGLQQEKFDFKKKIDFDKFVQSQGKRVIQVMGKIKDAKDGVRLGREALSDIVAQIERGEEPNETKFNAAVRGIAKAFNKGAMTEQDVADFKELQGFAGKGEAFVRKWLAGGVNEKIARNLLEVTSTTAKILDRRAQESANELLPGFKSEAFPGREAEVRKRSGIDESLAPTFKNDKRSKSVTKGGSIDNALAKFPKLTLESFAKLSEAGKKLLAERTGFSLQQIQDELQKKGK